MIPSFNNAELLTSTLLSVLVQDLGPKEMQIEVVDDYSDDDLASLVREVGRGRVSYYRHRRNVGHIENFHTCILRSKGEIVHLLHGDDMVLEGFYRHLQVGFDLIPDLGAAFCRCIFIDSQGNELSTAELEQPNAGVLHNALCRIALEQRIMTPSIVVRRAVYEKLGAFDRRLRCSEDWEMWVRIATSYPIWYEPKPLAHYRIHDQSNTGRHIRSAANMAYTRKAIKICQSYTPSDRAKVIARTARRTYAWSALETARLLLESGDTAGFWAQLREGLLLARPAPILKEVGRLVFKYATGNAWME
jgi:glycosyltransferase involved in cell wall biosynthesis